ncbi:MAG: hypothetical protein AAB414_00690 [Patescibacteria group bacterium]
MHKTLLIIVILLIIFAILLFITTRPKDGSLSNQPQAIPTTATQSQIFAVKSIKPPVSDLMQITYVTPIMITFTQAVDPKTFEYSIEPPIDVPVNFNGQNVIFKPKAEGPWWVIDQEYTLTILSARSTQGVYMANPYKIIFKAPLTTF